MPLSAGLLRHRVTLQQPINIQDPDTGENTVTWLTVGHPWAQVVPSSGREFITAQAEQSEVRGRIVIRWNSFIDATFRVIHESRAHNIIAVLPDPVSGREFQTLMVDEGVRYNGEPE